MKLIDLNPRKGDLVLMIGNYDPRLYQFWAMGDGYAVGKKGVELKKPIIIGGIELPLTIPLPKQKEGLIHIPLTAHQINLGLDEIISDLEMREGYELHAAIMRYSRDIPTRRFRR